MTEEQSKKSRTDQLFDDLAEEIESREDPQDLSMDDLEFAEEAPPALPTEEEPGTLPASSDPFRSPSAETSKEMAAKPSPTEEGPTPLDDVPLFAELDVSFRQEVSKFLKKKEFKNGETIIREGDRGKEFFLITKGEVVVYMGGTAVGLQNELNRLGPNDFFGEMSLFTAETRSATVRAATQVETLVLNREELLALVQASPEVSVQFLAALSGRINEMIRHQAKIQFTSLAEHRPSMDLYHSFPRQVLEQGQMVPLSLKGNHLLLAMVDPQNLIALDEIRRFLSGVSIEVMAISQKDYDQFVARNVKSGSRMMKKGLKRPKLTYTSTGEAERLQLELDGNEVLRILDDLLAESIDLGASDIHMQPTPEKLSVRLRVDGRLRDWERDPALPREYTQPLVSRIKVLAGLDLTEHRRPQDGRFSIRFRNIDFDFRVATIPTRDGERVTMRILNATANLIPLNQLVYVPRLAELVKEKVFAPSGLILVCGPTGTGKTTTLYSCLTERVRYSSEINVMTVEDPIEYTLKGASQVQVNHTIGVGFADVLHSFLRHDPNVIMVGETRDGDTAKLSAQAALTGHLVLTSLHATDTLSALTRLRELGLEPFLLASTLQVIIGQRLVRKLCPECTIPVEFPHEIEERLIEAGVYNEGDEIKLFRGRGCEHCGHTGYSGRMGVYEVLPITGKVRDLIMADTPKHEMRRALQDSDWVTMPQYCRFLIDKRMTDAAEVLRISAKEDSSL